MLVVPALLLARISGLFAIDDNLSLNGRPSADADELSARARIFRPDVIHSLHGVRVARSRLDRDEDLSGLIERRWTRCGKALLGHADDPNDAGVRGHRPPGRVVHREAVLRDFGLDGEWLRLSLRGLGRGSAFGNDDPSGRDRSERHPPDGRQRGGEAQHDELPPG